MLLNAEFNNHMEEYYFFLLTEHSFLSLSLSLIPFISLLHFLSIYLQLSLHLSFPFPLPSLFLTFLSCLSSFSLSLPPFLFSLSCSSSLPPYLPLFSFPLPSIRPSFLLFPSLLSSFFIPLSFHILPSPFFSLPTYPPTSLPPSHAVSLLSFRGSPR